MMEISVIDRCITPDTVVICAGRILVQQNPDRKSTRLNSSHSQISYAVFCLKKKKKYVYVSIKMLITAKMCRRCVWSHLRKVAVTDSAKRVHDPPRSTGHWRSKNHCEAQLSV